MPCCLLLERAIVVFVGRGRAAIHDDFRRGVVIGPSEIGGGRRRDGSRRRGGRRGGRRNGCNGNFFLFLRSQAQGYGNRRRRGRGSGIRHWRGFDCLAADRCGAARARRGGRRRYNPGIGGGAGGGLDRER